MTAAPFTTFVRGQWAWMAGRSGAEAVLAGGQPGETSEASPSLEGYPSRLMRATSTLTQICASVAAQTLRASGVSGNDVPAVFGSALGEVTIALDQLEMMITGDGQISPTRFKNSVHNTSAGVFSVAFGNRTSSTSLAAGPLTVAYAILEAQQLLADGAPEVLVVVGDEAMPAPLNDRGRWQAFAAGWVLARSPAPGDTQPVTFSEVGHTDATAGTAPSELHQHPCLGAYRLLDAVHHRREGAVLLGAEPDERLGVCVETTTTTSSEGSS